MPFQTMFANKMGEIKVILIAKNVSQLKGIFSTVCKFDIHMFYINHDKPRKQ